MDIATYMEKKRLKASEFASLVGASEQAVYKWLSGERRPSWKSIDKITQATNGAIKVSDIYGQG